MALISMLDQISNEMDQKRFSVGVFLEPLEGLAGVLLIDAVELLLHPDEFFGMDQDIERGKGQ